MSGLYVCVVGDYKLEEDILGASGTFDFWQTFNNGVLVCIMCDTSC